MPRARKPLEPLRNQVDADHPDPPVCRDPGGHVADRPSPSTVSDSPSRTPAYSTACHAVGKHVRQIHETVVRRPLRNLMCVSAPAAHVDTAPVPREYCRKASNIRRARRRCLQI